MVQNTQNAVKIANAFPILKNILSLRTNSLFTASYENPNMSQILRGNQALLEGDLDGSESPK